MRKRLLLISGTVSVGIGIVGIFVPVLPTTPFLLIAAACYIRSSPSAYRWLTCNRIFGAYLCNYLTGKGMPLKIKIFTLFTLWAVIVISIVLIQAIPIKILLGIVAIAVTVHIILIKPRISKTD